MIQLNLFFPELIEKYYITEDGKVYSTRKKDFLKPTVDKFGYIKYSLYGVDKKKYNRFAHRLVLTCYNYVENCENLTVNHKDGNKLNNQLDNLEWMTIEENNIHALQTKLNGKTGADNPNSRLTKEQVKEILLNQNCTYAMLAKKYNVSPNTISNIKRYITWKEEIEKILAEERSTTKSQ